MKIKTKINKMSNETVATAAMRVIDTINASDCDRVKESAYLTTLTGVSERYQSAVEPYSTVAATEAINAKAEERLQLFTNLYNLVYGLQNSSDGNIKTAAEKIFTVINMYGKAYSKERIADQAIRYMRMIETLKNADNAADLETLGITDQVTALDTVQQAYENLYLTRGNATSSNVSSSSLRTEMNNALKNMIDKVNAVANEYPTDDNVNLAKQVEQRINEIYVTAKSSETTSKVETATGETTEAATNETAVA